MTKSDVIEKLQSVFRDVFDNEGLSIGETTTADDLPDWDSLRHIDLVAATEKKFGVKFTTREVGTLSTVQGFLDLISKKCAA